MRDTMAKIYHQFGIPSNNNLLPKIAPPNPFHQGYQRCHLHCIVGPLTTTKPQTLGGQELPIRPPYHISSSPKLALRSSIKERTVTTSSVGHSL